MYREKYIKYKSKYLDLKYNLSGGNDNGSSQRIQAVAGAQSNDPVDCQAANPAAGSGQKPLERNSPAC